MNIGFHYFVTKTLAECAGFSQESSQIIAYACEYVDCQSQHRPMKIYGIPQNYGNFLDKLNGIVFDPTCTSCGGIQNILYHFEDIRKKVLAAFHFPPQGFVNGKFIWNTERNSQFALKYLEKLLNQWTWNTEIEKKYKFIQLGVILHTFQDSFSHQGFSADNSLQDNGVKHSIASVNGGMVIIPLITKLLGITGYNIGHGQVYGHPDTFNTMLLYEKAIRTDNYARFAHNNSRFMQAAKAVFQILTKFNANNSFWVWEDIEEKIFNAISYHPSDFNGYVKQFTNQFPNYIYYCDSKDWRQKAIKDHMPDIYLFNGDQKWFLFNQAAHEQRKAMFNWIQGKQI